MDPKYEESTPKYEESASKSEEEQVNPEFNLANPESQLERGLKSRHIQFLALGIFHCPSIANKTTDF